MTRALTVRFVEQVVASSARQEIPDGAMPGLYLVVQPSGSKSWAVRYRHKGMSRKLTLGPTSVLSLDEARQASKVALGDVAKGFDPTSARRTDPKLHGDLFASVSERFLQRHAERSGQTHAHETRRLLEREVLPAWGDKAIQSVTKGDVFRLLDSIIDRGSGTTANRTLAAIRRLFNWCIERDLLSVSPCSKVRPPAKETSRDRVLSDAEIRLFWQATEAMPFPFGPLLKLLLVTGQRRSEVGGMTAEERQGPLWTIPAARSKNATEHHVYLTPLALSLLEGTPKKGLTFTTNGLRPVSGFARAKAILDREMQKLTPDPISHFTLHDLRRTAATGMARLGHPVHVVEAILNHRTGSVSGIAAVYNRYNYIHEREKALSDWSQVVGSSQPTPIFTVCPSQ